MVLATLAVLIAPVLADLLSHGAKRVFGYLAIDSFYYLVVARNALDTGQWTFDQTHLTNGYHPLWQWTTAGLLAVSRACGLSDLGLLMLSVLVGLSLIAGAVALVGYAMLRAHGRVSPWLMLVVPGVVAIASTPLFQEAHDSWRFRAKGSTRPVVSTLWSYANGMESGLVLLAFAALLVFLVVVPRPRSIRHGVVLGLLAAGLTMARLDHGVFAVMMLGGVVTVARVWGERRMQRAAVVAVVTFVAVLGAYLVYNELVFGAAFPVSGARKSTFPRLSNGNVDKVLKLAKGPDGRWVPAASRAWQLVVPPLVAMVYGLHALRLRRRGPAVGVELRPARSAMDRVLVLCVPGVLLLAGYNFCFVRPNHQGHWYFPVTTLLCSLFVIRMLDQTRLTRRKLRRPRWLLAWLVVATAGTTGYFSAAHYRPTLNRDISRYYLKQGPRMRAYYEGTDAKFIEFYDALFAASTGLPTMNGYGLVLDDEGHQALDQGRSALVRLAIARGHDRVVSFNLKSKLTKEPSRRAMERYLRRYLSVEALEPYALELEYRSRHGTACIIRLIPRAQLGESISQGSVTHTPASGSPT